MHRVDERGLLGNGMFCTLCDYKYGGVASEV